MKPLPQLPEVIEEHRDLHWHREGASRVETPLGAEGFIEQVGFAGCLTDARWPGPSLYVAVCGRRDAILPRRVQKDPVLPDMAAKRRTGGTWQCLLRKARTWEDHVSSSSYDPPFSCRLGQTTIRHHPQTERKRPRHSSRTPARMGARECRPSR